MCWGGGVQRWLIETPDATTEVLVKLCLPGSHFFWKVVPVFSGNGSAQPTNRAFPRVAPEHTPRSQRSDCPSVSRSEKSRVASRGNQAGVSANPSSVLPAGPGEAKGTSAHVR